MACFKPGTFIDLAARESLPLPDVRGVTLRVTRGTVWVTQENDTQDIVLRAGDTWVVERNGLTLLEAQQDATVCAVGRKLEARVVAQRSGEGRWSAFWRHVGELATAQFAAPLRRTGPHV